MFWTDPYSKIPNRILLNHQWRGGFRHGSIKTEEQQNYDRWWRNQVTKILS